MGKPIKSIKYPFGIDQGMGTLAEEHDLANHIRQMMIQVLMTNPGERIPGVCRDDAPGSLG